MTKFHKEHLYYVQNFWDSILNKGDNVIDATIGNGYDCLYLSQRVLTSNSGFVFGYDVQYLAIKNTRKRLFFNLNPSLINRIYLFNKSHEKFGEVNKKNIKLIVYNLGYLPGSDKTIQSTAETTLNSIKNALDLNPKFISIITYSGHHNGELEENCLFNFLKNLPKNNFTISCKRWINREKFPSVFLLENINN